MENARGAQVEMPRLMALFHATKATKSQSQNHQNSVAIVCSMLQNIASLHTNLSFRGVPSIFIAMWQLKKWLKVNDVPTRRNFNWPSCVVMEMGKTVEKCWKNWKTPKSFQNGTNMAWTWGSWRGHISFSRTTVPNVSRHQPLTPYQCWWLQNRAHLHRIPHAVQVRSVRISLWYFCFVEESLCIYRSSFQVIHIAKAPERLHFFGTKELKDNLNSWVFSPWCLLQEHRPVHLWRDPPSCRSLWSRNSTVRPTMCRWKCDLLCLPN